MSPRRTGIALVVLLAVAFACGEDKTSAPPTETPSESDSDARPPAEQSASLLAKACDKHTKSAKKENCLCRMRSVRAEVGDELFAKLETAESAPTTDAVVEHLGGTSNLSRIYNAMRKASEQCKKGAAK